MQQLIHRVATVAVVALLAACADAPAGPAPVSPSLSAASSTASASATGAVRDVQEYLYDITGQRLGCRDGEVEDVIILSGKIHERVQTVADANGGWLFNRQTMGIDLAGTSERTGEAYRVRNQEQSVWREGSPQQSGYYRWKMRFTGEQSGQVFFVDFISRWTMNANGELVVDQGHFEGNCFI